MKIYDKIIATGPDWFVIETLACKLHLHDHGLSVGDHLSITLTITKEPDIAQPSITP